jgi:hypothetical protein
MEMALRAQSPLCSRGRPLLVVRPAAAAAGLAQVSCGRFVELSVRLRSGFVFPPFRFLFHSIMSVAAKVLIGFGGWSSVKRRISGLGDL